MTSLKIKKKWMFILILLFFALSLRLVQTQFNERRDFIMVDTFIFFFFLVGSIKWRDLASLMNGVAKKGKRDLTSGKSSLIIRAMGNRPP